MARISSLRSYLLLDQDTCAAALSSSSLLAGFVSRRSSTASTRPTPKKLAQTRLTMARVK